MIKKTLMVAAMALTVTAAQAQKWTEAEERYIVKTAGAVDNRPVATADDGKEGEKKADDPQDFVGKYFRYVSMCDWQDGMRFMVIPNQKDLVVKTFADASTGRMVSSMTLRHKILVYKGHEDTGGLHERINFQLEEDTTKCYYFEVPTASFEEYCYSKTGIPTLAYLGDVDTAVALLTGKQVKVLIRDVYQDTDVAGDGYNAVDLYNQGKQNDIMTIVKVGVGTRNYPVKIIFKDKDNNEYFQTVAISRTNSGMRDEEFDVSDTKPHTFYGAFELLGDKVAVAPEYQQYIDTVVYTLYQTEMLNDKRDKVSMSRLSTFIVKDIQKRAGSDYATMTLQGQQSGKEYTKEVTFEERSVIGDIAGQKEDFFGRLFAIGDPMKIPDVKKEHLPQIRKGTVLPGFTEAEVRLALGEPSDESLVRNGEYSWTYQQIDTGRSFRVVYFNSRTKKVKRVTR